MNTYTKLKPLGKLAAVTAATLATTSLINCGGGGAATDDLIVRPRTLEKLVIIYQSAVQYEFIRSATSGKATNSGDIETGSVLYTRLRSEQTHQTSNNVTLEITEPSSVGSATYTYQGINDVSGQLTIDFENAEYSGLGVVNEAGGAPNARAFSRSFTINFGAGSTSLLSSTTRLTSTFTPYGTVISGVFVASTHLDRSAEDDVAGYTSVDATLLGTCRTQTDAGSIASAGYDYDPDFNKRQSKVSPASLNGYLYSFVDGADTNDNFTMDFTKGAVIPTSGFEETGTNVFTPAGAGFIVGAAGYDYKRIAGTDSAQVIISGGTAQDGPMTMIYGSGDTENQNISGTYTTAKGNTGTFSATTSP